MSVSYLVDDRINPFTKTNTETTHVVREYCDRRHTKKSVAQREQADEFSLRDQVCSPDQ